MYEYLHVITISGTDTYSVDTKIINKFEAMNIRYVQEATKGILVAILNKDYFHSIRRYVSNRYKGKK